MTKLIELAERCMAAREPDRELDIEIALAQPEKFFNAGPYYDGAPDRIGRIDEEGERSVPGNGPDMLVPRYTASLDAAMTLIEGSGRAVADFISQAALRLQSFPLYLMAGLEYREYLARFVVAAALRAHAAVPGSEKS